MESNFFETNSYFIDERVNVLSFNNIYKIYNEKGFSIGSIVQKLTTGQKLQRLIFHKSMLPFFLEIKDSNNEVVATLSRGWTLFMSKTLIQDLKGNITGTIQQEFQLFKPTFKVFNSSETIIANISGDWRARKFVVKNSYDIQIGSITKKWAGLGQEMFTTADKYNVNIDSKYANDKIKIAILASAITIDMVYKSGK